MMGEAVQARNPSDVHAPVAADTHQIEVAAGSRWLVPSGQIGMRVDGTQPADAIGQIEVALDNLRGNLAAAGMEVGGVVKLIGYLVGDVDAARRRDALAAFFGSHRPCMTLLHVAAPATTAVRVEIDAWAAREAPTDGPVAVSGGASGWR
ncbi:RidA family protein [Pleomorphomonas koreensis]|uniref:RidA family protein n=1 Tax=Pleomorphomonas koreensis TaxID=257440 RepID=UPI001AEBC344|nr:RidA family protein [Pleomorphomonas koreensis]